MAQQEGQKLLALCEHPVTPPRIPAPDRGPLHGSHQAPKPLSIHRRVADAPSHRVAPIVFTRSPGFLGISDGATTVQSCPKSRIWRYKPYPIGSAS